VRLGGGQEPGLEGPLRVVAFVVTAVFAVFALRLVQLQVIEGEALSLRSQRNFIRTVRVEPPRGDVLDRNGEVLATSRPAFGLQVIPAELRRPALTFDLLGHLLGRDADDLRRRVGEPRGRARYQPVRLAADLDYPALARVETHRYALAGVVTDVRARRHYVGGHLAAHVLGTLGEVSGAQLQRRAYADYRPGDQVGQSGVERLLEDTLHGRPGGRNVVVDVSGREMEVIDEVKPVRGGTAVLALDAGLQRAAVEALEGTPAGAAVALDPRTGDVLALASHPSFDPNDFAGRVDPATWRALREDPWNLLQNRAVAGQYPPGSTYKALVAAAVLEEGTVGPEERVFCPGHFRLGRRVYRCWKRVGHGPVDLHEALVHSCDVYFYQAGLGLGVDRLARFARGFGLGRTTGSPFADERAGLIPTRAWKERRFGEPWVRGETVSASIGQGFNLVTPLQLAVAFAAIANGGRVLEPRLVLQRHDPAGALVEQPSVRERGRVPVDPAHLVRVREALEAVVMSPRGTGGRARVPGVRVAGKTGTSQVVGLEHTEELEDDEVPVRHRDHAWFAAFAPADDPRIVVVVLAEHSGGGGAEAAPRARRILEAFFDEHPELRDEQVARAD